MRYVILLLLLLGLSGWLARRQASQQNRLHRQLADLTAVLAAENDLAARTVQDILKSMEAAAVKNRNQPADLAVLRQATTVQARASQLVAAVRAYASQLRRATGNAETRPLQHLDAPIGPGLGTGSRPGQVLAQQLAAYTGVLRQAEPAGPGAARTPPLRLPAWEKTTPVADALADLTQLESEIVIRQTHVLRRLARTVGARHWLTHPLAIAAAESNVVAPGGTYRAELDLVNYFSARELRLHMSCDGRPVALDANGVGLVRFRAPRRPGPASWIGKIRLTQNGRDTTFAVRVPYRVAPR